MEFCVDSGLTTQAQYHTNLQLYPHYVPTYRVGKTTGNNLQLEAWHKLTKKQKAVIWTCSPS